MKRFLAIVLSMIIVLSMLPVEALAVTVPVSGGGNVDVDKAMHFIIRHWHAATDSSTRIGNAYVLDGYIVPNAPGSPLAYSFYIRNDDDDGENFEPYTALTDKAQQAGYIQELDFNNGVIVFSPNLSVSESTGKPYESFSSYAISAGHSAATVGDDDSLTVAYDASVHLVKSHAFYINTGLIVDGSSQPAVIGGPAAEKHSEIDTAQGYVCTAAFKDGSTDYHKGELISAETYDGLSPANQAMCASTKIYSTTEGLHTDKTATVLYDEERDKDLNLTDKQKYELSRTFNIDLETWYVGGSGLEIALILDASGSMAFTADTPRAINVNDPELGLDKKTIRELMGKALKKEDNISTAAEWQEKFLSVAQVNRILNYRNTDNSLLGYSDYGYFIYDKRSSTQEFVPIGYWDAGLPNGGPLLNALVEYYPFNQGNRFYENWSSNDNSVRKRAWLYDEIGGKFAQTVDALAAGDSLAFTSYDTVHDWNQKDNFSRFGGLSDGNGWDIANQNTQKGFLLNYVPGSNSFSLAFTIDNKSSLPFKSSDPIEVLYIGTIDGTGGDYYRIVYQDGILYGCQNDGSTSDGEPLVDVSSGKTTVTFVVQPNQDGSAKLTAYQERAQSVETAIPLSDGYRIVPGAIQDTHAGDPKKEALYIDNLCVFEGALAPDDIAELGDFLGAINSPLTGSGTVPARTGSGKTLATIDYRYLSNGANNSYGRRLDNVGWYYVNSSSNWKNFTDYETAKFFMGLRQQQEKPITIEMKDAVTVPSGVTLTYGNVNTESTYTPEENYPTSLRFYIDSVGYLRCFYLSNITPDSDDLWGASYVYDNGDAGYIKVEALQRALGNFVNMLYDVSPASRVSAVRFSLDLGSDTNKALTDENLGTLVLLDWTNDPAVSSNSLSLKYGTGDKQGAATGHSPSANGKAQYNYILTGGTFTQMGLQAFNKHLLNKVNPNARKYLIIFTDGLDNEVDNYPDLSEHPATKLTDALKEKTDAYGDGFTVYTIMLTGGPVIKGTDQYSKAEGFLRGLASSTASGDEYFFSTDPSELVEGESPLLGLLNIFTGKILNDITEKLEDYTMQDYIDPRFDLVDRYGRLWQLQTGGHVVVTNANGKVDRDYWITESKAKEWPWIIELTGDGDVTESAHNAELHYDPRNQMYFLRWTGQTIPVASIDVQKLTVWHSRVTVRAKEDFIGGKAVLTNGDLNNMNYVYFPGDANKNSGTSDSYRELDSQGKITGYPSKGFPRVTVNVRTPENVLPKEMLIYMGEPIAEAAVKGIVSDLAESGDPAQWYWEYLLRYDALHKNEKVFETLISTGELQLSYFYLPNTAGTNQTGMPDRQDADELGQIIYAWKTDGKYSADMTKDTIPRSITLEYTYKPYIVSEDDPDASPDTTSDEHTREALTNKLIAESDDNGNRIYQWNRAYKKAVGSADGKAGSTGETVYIVSGEVALRLLLTKSDIEYLQQVMPGGTLTYNADLKRSYGRSIADETVATFTATFTVPAEAPSGDVIVEAVPTYNANYSNYSTSTEYALPIGTYRFAGYEASNTFQYTFTPPVALNIAAAGSKAFTRFGSQYDEKGYLNGARPLTDFPAPFNSAPSLYLGTGSEIGLTRFGSHRYTDERYALLEIRIQPRQDAVPQTGDNSNIQMWIALMVVAIGTMIAFHPRRKAAKARR